MGYGTNEDAHGYIFPINEIHTNNHYYFPSEPHETFRSSLHLPGGLHNKGVVVVLARNKGQIRSRCQGTSCVNSLIAVETVSIQICETCAGPSRSESIQCDGTRF